MAGPLVRPNQADVLETRSTRIVNLGAGSTCSEWNNGVCHGYLVGWQGRESRAAADPKAVFIAREKRHRETKIVPLQPKYEEFL